MADWATDVAKEILMRVRRETPHAELQAWLAAKLHVIHQQGVGEGIEGLGKALTPEQVKQ